MSTSNRESTLTRWWHVPISQWPQYIQNMLVTVVNDAYKQHARVHTSLVRSWKACAYKSGNTPTYSITASHIFDSNPYFMLEGIGHFVRSLKRNQNDVQVHVPEKGIERYANIGSMRSWNVTSLSSDKQCQVLVPFLKAWSNDGITLLQET